MSSKNCQDFEVKYINDLCVCVCFRDVHLYLYAFTEEGYRFRPVWPLNCIIFVYEAIIFPLNLTKSTDSVSCRKFYF